MENQIIESALAAIVSAFGAEATKLSIEQIKTWFSKASHSVDSGARLDSKKIEQMAVSLLESGTPEFDAEVTRRNLARWFEVPQEEFLLTPKAQLEPEVLIRHIYLENLFKEWLTQWGYETYIGEDLEGKENIDFTPDVYGKLVTLHGVFEVCVNFVCDNPPSQYRVRALLETLESYATDTSEFKWGDVYILATPFQFGRGTSASIKLQSSEEKYTVVKLEGDDIYELKNARDVHARLIQLMEHVERSSVNSPTRE